MQDARLEREARAFSRYLSGLEPDGYVVSRYAAYHRDHSLAVEGFDAFLASFASRGPFCAAASDSYAARFRKRSALRKKLVLMLALLETSPRPGEHLDGTGGAPGLAAWWRLARYGTSHLLALAASLVLVAPVHLWFAVRGRA